MLAGRHLILTFGGGSSQSLDNLLRKSVQIVADDGVPRDRVVVGIGGSIDDGHLEAEASAIAVVNALRGLR